MRLYDVCSLILTEPHTNQMGDGKLFQRRDYEAASKVTLQCLSDLHRWEESWCTCLRIMFNIKRIISSCWEAFKNGNFLRVYKLPTFLYSWSTSHLLSGSRTSTSFSWVADYLTQCRNWKYWKQFHVLWISIGTSAHSYHERSGWNPTSNSSEPEVHFLPVSKPIIINMRSSMNTRRVKKCNTNTQTIGSKWEQMLITRFLSLIALPTYCLSYTVTVGSFWHGGN